MREYLWAGTIKHLSDLPGLSLSMLSRIAGAGVFLGVFLAPFGVAAFPGRRELLRRPWLVLLAPAAVGLFLAVGRSDHGVRMSLLGMTGLGPCSLAACHLKPAGLLGWRWFWFAVGLFGMTTLAFLPFRLSAYRWRWNDCAPYGAGFLLAFLALLAGQLYFDRYYLVLLPAGIAAAVLAVPVSALRLAPGLGLMAAWSVLGTWDYLAWTAAKWEAGRQLVAQGFAPEEVFNGLEWNALHGYEKRMAQARLRDPGRAPAGDAWMKEARFEAFVAFAPAITNSELERVGEVLYFCPLTMRTERVYLWRERR